MNRNVEVMEETWHNLLVLDACRYDYFAEVFGKYLRGNLKRVKSVGSSTLEWCLKSFPDRYDDIVYVSANPFINSMSVRRPFNAKDHFYKVIDVWDWGWNEEWKTVHPREVNSATFALRRKHPDKRFIVHYMQPHAPYIGSNMHAESVTGPEASRDAILSGVTRRSNSGGSNTTKILLKSLEVLRPFFQFNDRLARKHSLFNEHLDWKIREFMNLPPASPVDEVRRNRGTVGLRRAYQMNLEIVLRYVRDLANDLSGRTIVTSDHGERLGEGGGYSHYFGADDGVLLEVPWLEIENAGGTEGPPADGERDRVKERIRKLKNLRRI